MHLYIATINNINSHDDQDDFCIIFSNKMNQHIPYKIVGEHRLYVFLYLFISLYHAGPLNAVPHLM